MSAYQSGEAQVRDLDIKSKTISTHRVVWVDSLLLDHLAIRGACDQCRIILCVTTHTDDYLTGTLNEEGHEVKEGDVEVGTAREDQASLPDKKSRTYAFTPTIQIMVDISMP